jgi:DNA-binding response OmpR family regulator
MRGATLPMDRRGCAESTRMGEQSTGPGRPVVVMPASRTNSVPVPPTVLVVDDDSTMRLVLERWLRFHGFMPLVVASCEDGKTAAQHHDVAAFIIDLNVGIGVSGIEVLTWLRLQPKYERTPVFVLTGQIDIPAENRDVIRGHGARVFYKGQSMQALVAGLKSQLIDNQPE